jgi:hydroxybutyrate-dimer hydrolase
MTNRATALFAGRRLASLWLAPVSAGALIVAAAGVMAEARDKFMPPPTILHAFYDGNTNDLLTAGLGKSGLGSMTPPGFADALHPAAEELRRSAVFGNYRALVDPTRNGG